MKKLRNIVFWRVLLISVILGIEVQAENESSTVIPTETTKADQTDGLLAVATTETTGAEGQTVSSLKIVTTSPTTQTTREAEGQTESSLKIVTTSPTTQTTRTTTPLDDTRGEWATLNGTEYYVSKRGVSKNNTDAEEYCNQQGGTLAWVKTQKIQEFIASLVKDETGLPYMFFIGLHDRFKNGSFYWNEDEPLQSGFWSSGEPNKKHKEEYCVGMGWMYTYEEKLLWRDVVCYVGAAGPKGFVCQRTTVAGTTELTFEESTLVSTIIPVTYTANTTYENETVIAHTTTSTTQSSTSFPDTVTVVVSAVAGVTFLLLVGLGVFCCRHVKERNNERKMIKILKDHAENDCYIDEIIEMEGPIDLKPNSKEGLKNDLPLTAHNRDSTYLPMASASVQEKLKNIDEIPLPPPPEDAEEMPLPPPPVDIDETLLPPPPMDIYEEMSKKPVTVKNIQAEVSTDTAQNPTQEYEAMTFKTKKDAEVKTRSDSTEKNNKASKSTHKSKLQSILEDQYSEIHKDNTKENVETSAQDYASIDSILAKKSLSSSPNKGATFDDTYSTISKSQLVSQSEDHLKEEDDALPPPPNLTDKKKKKSTKLSVKIKQGLRINKAKATGGLSDGNEANSSSESENTSVEYLRENEYSEIKRNAERKLPTVPEGATDKEAPNGETKEQRQLPFLPESQTRTAAKEALNGKLAAEYSEVTSTNLSQLANHKSTVHVKANSGDMYAKVVPDISADNETECEYAEVPSHNIARLNSTSTTPADNLNAEGRFSTSDGNAECGHVEVSSVSISKYKKGGTQNEFSANDDELECPYAEV